MLDQQWARLTPLEQDVLLWLAIEREPLRAETLRANLLGHGGGMALIEVLRSLRRRSLIEQCDDSFTLQSVVAEYLTQHLIEVVSGEIEGGVWQRFQSHALVKAPARAYVRANQVRLLVAPLAERLLARLGREGLSSRLRAGLAALQVGGLRIPGYAAGNVLNLLIHLGYDLKGFDCSHLSVWQAHLAHARLPHTNFAHADLTGSVFKEAFRPQNTLAWSPDGLLLAAAGDGAVYVWRLADHQLAAICRGSTGYAYALVFSPDSTRLACAGTDPTIRVWEVGTCQPLAALRGHTGTIYSLAWAPDGATIYSAGADHTICAWQLAGESRTIVGRHSDEVHALALSVDGAYLVSGGLDRQVWLWDVHGPAGKALQAATGLQPCCGGTRSCPEQRWAGCRR
ncbi:MAG: hypothetical protein HC822_12820 [Oscillochloris sp.]|nr:hypothetical protein [Oscillochloris sp.]